MKLPNLKLNSPWKEFPKKPRCKPANSIAVLRPKLPLFYLHVLSPSPTVRKTIGFSHRARCVSHPVNKTPRVGRPRTLNLKAATLSGGNIDKFDWRRWRWDVIAMFFEFTGVERITKANRKCFSNKMVIYKCFSQNVTVFLQISPFHDLKAPKGMANKWSPNAVVWSPSCFCLSIEIQ